MLKKEKTFDEIVEELRNRTFDYYVIATDLADKTIYYSLMKYINENEFYKYCINLRKEDNDNKFHVIDCEKFLLVPIKKFKYNIAKYGDIKDIMKKLKDFLIENDINEINIIMDSFMEKGLVEKEIENQFKKVFKDKDNIIINIVK